MERKYSTNIQSQSGSHFSASKHYERPMLLNAWTQTTMELATDDVDESITSLLYRKHILSIANQSVQKKVNDLSERVDKIKANLLYARTMLYPTPKLITSSTPTSTGTPVTKMITDTTAPSNHERKEVVISVETSSNCLEIRFPPVEPIQELNNGSSVHDLQRKKTNRKQYTITIEKQYDHNGHNNQQPACSDLCNVNRIAKINGNNVIIYNNFNTLLSIPRSKVIQPSAKENSEKVLIGPNGTLIDRKAFDQVNWASAKLAIRKLLILLFGRETLAMNSTASKLSLKKPLKKHLDPIVTEDIVYDVSQRFSVPEKVVRNAIDTICAYEYRMKQKKLKKHSKFYVSNKENCCF